MRTSRGQWLLRVAVAALVPLTLAAADDPTTGLLQAIRVQSSIHVTLAGDKVREGTQAELEYALAEHPTTWFPLTTGLTFVASRPVKVAYPRLNPLTTQITASLATAKDPSNEALVKFMDAILKIPKLLDDQEHAGFSALKQCSGFTQLVADLESLDGFVRAPRNIDQSLGEWRAAIEKQPGPGGVDAARKLIAVKAKQVADSAKNARDKLAEIRAAVEKLRVNRKLDAQQKTLEEQKTELEQERQKRVAAEQALAKRGKPAPKPAPTTKPAPQGGAAGRPPGAGSGTTTTPAPPAAANPARPPQPEPESCDLDVLLQRAFVAMLGTGDVDARILELDDLAEDLKGLAASLEPFAAERNWDGDAYVFATIPPAADTIKTLSIKVVPIALSTVPREGLHTDTLTKKAAAGDIVIRRFSTFAPEIAAGLVVGNIRKPSYGTTKDASGATIVARKDDQPVSLSAALMLNAVCKCGTDSFAYPMFQVGALADPKSPGLLFGAGLRFIRPSHLGLATGAALVWIKDLDKLTVGGPVGGTTDIDNDLKFRPVVKMYFTFQYTF